jgi:hypothetical protein
MLHVSHISTVHGIGLAENGEEPPGRGRVAWFVFNASLCQLYLMACHLSTQEGHPHGARDTRGQRADQEGGVLDCLWSRWAESLGSPIS